VRLAELTNSKRRIVRICLSGDLWVQYRSGVTGFGRNYPRLALPESARSRPSSPRAIILLHPIADLVPVSATRKSLCRSDFEIAFAAAEKRNGILDNWIVVDDELKQAGRTSSRHASRVIRLMFESR
jgi:hypothetical protein